RGAGQTLNIQVLPGDRTETYSISLTDPSLWDTDYSGAGTLYFRSRDYDEFDEERYGGNLQLGRRFGTRWTGNLTTRLESINLSNIEPDRPTDVFEVQDRRDLTGVGVTLSRTSIDDPYRPRKGQRLEIGAQQIGLLGGDFDFTKLEASHSIFFAVNEDFLGRATILSFKTEVGYIPQGRESVPVYERYYNGGNSFRGFDFRTISPKGIANDSGLPTNDPIGGTYSFFFGTELEQPVFEEMISIVGFIDTGTVSFNPGFDEYRVSAGLGIRVYVPQLSPAPLAFDFGFPLLSEDRDEDRLFSFSIDLPY
ncbi:MAG: outer membrane protein assembly factor, partial [Phycisphaerales bacterium]|nr:outer membrane protein assembly factor [Phycisphaerales bacterium]